LESLLSAPVNQLTYPTIISVTSIAFDETLKSVDFKSYTVVNPCKLSATPTAIIANYRLQDPAQAFIITPGIKEACPNANSTEIYNYTVSLIFSSPDASALLVKSATNETSWSIEQTNEESKVGSYKAIWEVSLVGDPWHKSKSAEIPFSVDKAGCKNFLIASFESKTLTISESESANFEVLRFVT
jgi:hypothetical protein